MALQRDYLVRMLTQFFQAMVRSLEREKEKSPRDAADSIEEAIGEATDIDGGVLLSLSPDSIGMIMQVSGVDSRVVEYIANGLELEAHYLDECQDSALADLRRSQARALACAYGFETAPVYSDEEADSLIAAAQERLDF